MKNTTRATTQQTRQARAERIADAAADLLLRWGYKRVTIDDIAEAAGVGKGTIYLHWKTREELFYAVLGREYAEALEEVLATAQQDPSAVLLPRMMRALYLAVSKRPLVRAVFLADLTLLDKLAKGLDAALQANQDAASLRYLQLLQDAGLVRADWTTQEIAFALDALLGGFMLSGALGSNQFDLTLERKADLLEEMLARSFVERTDLTSETLLDLSTEVIALFAAMATELRGYLRQAYDERKEQP